MRHSFIAEKQDSLLLIVDIQQAMLKAIAHAHVKAITRCVNQLSKAAEILEIPIIVTEHYKKGFGPTIPEVTGGIQESTVFQKEYFSACLENGFLEMIRQTDRNTIIITGMETHVCVLQTGLDLLNSGYRVHVVKDALASRYKTDWQTGLTLFQEAGAVITTAETVLFQWLCRSNTSVFRQLLPIIKLPKNEDENV